MSTETDIAILAAKGFVVTRDTGQFWLVRVLNHEPVAGGDLGPVSGSYNAALSVAGEMVDRILKDERERLSLGNRVLGAPGSSQGGYFTTGW